MEVLVKGVSKLPDHTTKAEFGVDAEGGHILAIYHDEKKDDPDICTLTPYTEKLSFKGTIDKLFKDTSSIEIYASYNDNYHWGYDDPTKSILWVRDDLDINGTKFRITAKGYYRRQDYPWALSVYQLEKDQSRYIDIELYAIVDSRPKITIELGSYRVVEATQFFKDEDCNLEKVLLNLRRMW